MKINVEMSVFNNIEITKIAVDSFFKNTDNNCKLMIVENNSSDNSREWIKTIRDIENVEVFLPNENIGCVGARNLGIKHIDKDCDFFVSTDNDIVFTPHWDSYFVDFMEKNKNIGISGPCTSFAGNPQKIEIDEKIEMSQYEKIFEMSKRIRNENKNKFRIAPHYWPVVGFFLFIRKKVLEDVGLFDENLVSWADESDYCRRTQDKGWDLAYIYDIYIHHWGHASKGTDGAHYVSEIEKSMDYFKDKWGTTH